MSSSSFLQTKHHSSFNMQQMIREEVEGMARPKRFFSSSCRTRLSTPSELTVGNPTCNKCSALVLDINFCGLWGKSIELKQCSTALYRPSSPAPKINFDEMGVVSPSWVAVSLATWRRNNSYPPRKIGASAMKHQEMDVPRDGLTTLDEAL
ncbi:hypothetical protein AAG906_012830 [Vitis piasezkii]